jgi:hypothetical protein
MGFVLLVLGASLILYGNSFPPNIVVQNRVLTKYNVNILMLFGGSTLCIGGAVLLFCFFTCSKPSRALNFSSSLLGLICVPSRVPVPRE